MGSKLAILLFVGGTVVAGLLIYKPPKKNVVEKYPAYPSPTVTPYIEEIEETVKPDEDALRKMSIEVLNGSQKVGSAPAMAKFLKEKGFNMVKVGDADRSDYQNVLIRFRPEDVAIAQYLIEMIKSIYPAVEKAPLATDNARIMLILGKP